VLEISPQLAPAGLVQCIDPIAFLTAAGFVHHHQGDQSLVHRLAGRWNRLKPVAQPGGVSRIPVFTRELEAILFAARDAEFLADVVPAVCVIKAHRIP
jgi:hypothetical protein